MSFCKNCGAYIPDGQISCLACGFRETQQHQNAAAAAQNPGPQEDDLQEVMDRHRRLQQEKNRQWAKQEKERRDRQRENRRWAEEEYARRQAQKELQEEERRRQAEEDARRQEQQRQSRTEEPFGVRSTRSGNTALAALSYLSVLFVVPFLAAPKDEYAMFHAKQGLRLFIFSALADIIGAIFPLAWIFSLARIYFIIKGISNAINGKKEPLPYIGTIGDL